MMTYLQTNTPQFFSDICEEMRLFIDTRKIEKAETVPGEGFALVHSQHETAGRMESRAALYRDGERADEYTYTCAAEKGALASKRAAKRAAKISAYRALSGCFNKQMPWGSLTGIRPTKLLRDSISRHGGDGAEKLFINEFDVSRGKYDFAKAIVDVQRPLLPAGGKDIDVYIGIPFCVTRCAYCSFASNTPDVFAGAEDMYVDALMRELETAEEVLAGRNVRAVYVGCGTPTAIGEKNLERILARAAGIGRGAKEFTVEAGRPDTITPEKLQVIRDAGARRISVNTQTMRDDTLQRIGRCHTASAFLDAFALANGMGFDAINVDVIAGLPGESIDDVRHTLSQIIGLGPQNVTVHTLAVKRASAFAKDNMGAFPTNSETAGMADTARKMLETNGYRAYYMYRQKYMKGSVENAGYALPGSECLYNIDNMEEACNVAAFGAGAISKAVYPGENRIERAANVKDLRDYISRLDEMRLRKQGLFSTAE